jgi:hypothetical protein
VGGGATDVKMAKLEALVCVTTEDFGDPWQRPVSPLLARWLKEIWPIARRETAVEVGLAFQRKMRVTLLISSYIGRFVDHRVFGCCLTQIKAQRLEICQHYILFSRYENEGEPSHHSVVTVDETSVHRNEPAKSSVILWRNPHKDAQGSGRKKGRIWMQIVLFAGVALNLGQRSAVRVSKDGVLLQHGGAEPPSYETFIYFRNLVKRPSWKSTFF